MKHVLTTPLTSLFLLIFQISYAQCGYVPEIGLPSSVGLCPGVTRDAVIVNWDGVPAATWYKDGNLIADASGGTYTISSAGEYYAVLDHGNGCVVESNRINVFNTNTGIVDAGPDTVMCVDGHFERMIEFSGSNNVQWYLNGNPYQESSIGYVFISPIYQSQFVDGKILLEARTVGGCETPGIGSFEIAMAPKLSLSVTLGPDQIVCEGQTVTLSPQVLSTNTSGYFTSLWKVGSTWIMQNSYDYTVSSNMPATQIVSVHDAYTGCQGYDTLRISPVDPAIGTAAGDDQQYCVQQGPVLLTGTVSGPYAVSGSRWIHARYQQILVENEEQLSYTPSQEEIVFDEAAPLVYYVKDQRGCNYSDTVIVTADQEQCQITSLADKKITAADIRFYPVPASTYVSFECPGTPVKYEITDLSGKLVQHEMNVPGNRIELQNLKKGFYLVMLYFDGSTVCEKIAVE